MQAKTGGGNQNRAEDWIGCVFFFCSSACLVLVCPWVTEDDVFLKKKHFKSLVPSSAHQPLVCNIFSWSYFSTMLLVLSRNVCRLLTKYQTLLVFSHKNDFASPQLLTCIQSYLLPKIFRTELMVWLLDHRKNLSESLQPITLSNRVSTLTRD